MNVQMNANAAHPYTSTPAVPAAPPGWGAQQATGGSALGAAIPFGIGGVVFLGVGGVSLVSSAISIAASILPIAPLTSVAHLLPSTGFGGLLFGGLFSLGSLVWFAVARGLYTSARDRAWLAEHGLRGQARIVAVKETGIRLNHQPFFDLDVLVELGDRPAYPARFRQLVPMHQLGLLQPGATLEVRIDPRNPQKLASV